jgi:hypothetical protein
LKNGVVLKKNNVMAQEVGNDLKNPIYPKRNHFWDGLLVRVPT